MGHTELKDPSQPLAPGNHYSVIQEESAPIVESVFVTEGPSVGGYSKIVPPAHSQKVLENAL